MLQLGILKTWNSTTYKAGVQLAGSLTTYLDDISVSVSIPSSAMVVGNYVLVAIPGGNPRDACIVASWPQGSSGGGGGSKIQDADGDTYLWVEKTADEDKIHGVVKGVEAFLLHDDGIIDLAKQSGAKGYKSDAVQAIPTSTATKVVLDAEAFDIQGEFDSTTNYRFTAKKAGLYIAIGHLTYTATVDQQIYQARIYKNGAQYSTCSLINAGAGFLAPVAVDVVSLAVGDYLELYAYHTAGSDQNVLMGIANTYLSVAKVA